MAADEVTESEQEIQVAVEKMGCAGERASKSP